MIKDRNKGLRVLDYIDENEILNHPQKEHKKYDHNEIVDDYSDDSEEDEDAH